MAVVVSGVSGSSQGVVTIDLDRVEGEAGTVSGVAVVEQMLDGLLTEPSARMSSSWAQ